MEVTHQNETSDIAETRAEDKQLTRQQKRMLECIQEEAKETHQKLCKSFFDYFVTCENPEGEDVTERILKLSAQWKTYCKRRELIKDAYTLTDDYCLALVAEYKKNKLNPNEDQPQA